LAASVRLSALRRALDVPSVARSVLGAIDQSMAVPPLSTSSALATQPSSVPSKEYL